MLTINNMKTKPHAIIFSGYGLNCEDETKAAFEMAGGTADIIHLNDIIAKPGILKKADVLIVGGGFAYGDDTGAGKAYGNRLKQHLGREIEEFLQRDTLMIGICNGFQVLTAGGFLPGALVGNTGGRYLCRWVDLDVVGESPWLKGMSRMSLPIAHGEGNFYASAETLKKLKQDNGVALKYVAGEMAEHFDLPANPNGSLDNIAAVSAREGRVLGMMPHPERAVSFFQLPHWTYLREEYVRQGEALPQEGPGLQLFKNAVQYFV